MITPTGFEPVSPHWKCGHLNLISKMGRYEQIRQGARRLKSCIARWSEFPSKTFARVSHDWSHGYCAMKNKKYRFPGQESGTSLQIWESGLVKLSYGFFWYRYDLLCWLRHGKDTFLAEPEPFFFLPELFADHCVHHFTVLPFSFISNQCISV